MNLTSRFDPWPRSVGKRSGVAVSCDVGPRCSSDPALLWVKRRPTATAPIRPLAWEPPYATGAALKRQKKKTKTKTNKQKTGCNHKISECLNKSAKLAVFWFFVFFFF